MIFRSLRKNATAIGVSNDIPGVLAAGHVANPSDDPVLSNRVNLLNLDSRRLPRVPQALGLGSPRIETLRDRPFGPTLRRVDDHIGVVMLRPAF